MLTELSQATLLLLLLIIDKDGWSFVSLMGEERNANRGSTGRKAWTTWMWMGAHIKMYIQDLGWEAVGWSRLA